MNGTAVGMAAGTVADTIMLTDKADILRYLKSLAAFDKGSPYVSVQLPVNGKPQFYRSSAHGVIFTKDFIFGASVIHVSLTHFIDCLKNFPEDAVELGVSKNGILRIFGTSSDVLVSESHVLTVSEGQAGGFHHDIGERTVILDPSVFSKIDVRPFTCVVPPIVSQGRLMLAANTGATIMWTGPETLLKVPGLSPREAFLRAVAGGTPVDELAITAKGYWGATIGDSITYIKGHLSGQQIFENYNVPAQELTRLPANRLLVGLNAAVGLLEPVEKVVIDPHLGVLAEGKFGSNRNSLGQTGDWPKFGIMAKTAKTILHVLEQAFDDEAVLYSTISTGLGNTMRIKRGPFEVNFRIY